jgi:integrase
MHDQLSPTSSPMPSSSLAFRNFSQTCKSPETRGTYTKFVNRFMNYLQIPRGEYDKLLEKDPKIIQMDICDYITFLRQIHASPATISLNVAALTKFFTMNDIISLNWKKIKSFEPEKEKVAEDRPYTHEEIKSLLDKSSDRNRAIILLMSSSGVRVGVVSQLRIKDLKAIDRYNIYKINVYPRSKLSAYVTFCTPECRNAIDGYIDWRKRFGERITDDSPLFRRDFNVHGNLVRDIRKITRATIMRFMSKLVRDAGLRNMPLENQGYKRAEIMLSHGFRKFFETNAFKAGMDNMYLRRLMGQKSGLEDAYLKLSEEELLEGDSKHTGYIGIIDQLTINEENRLKRENIILKNEVGEIRQALDELEKVKKHLGLS